MSVDIHELIFSTRGDFRAWLDSNAETSGGVWLVFGKTKAVKTLTANDALEEALCFGWIDGQMQGIDNTKYMKYFSRRRGKSPWSDKNKKIVEILRKNDLMTELGERAIENAKKNGIWDNSPSGAITDEQIAEFAEKLVGISPAYDNFFKQSRSAKVVNIRMYLSVKSEQLRQRNFEKIIDMLNKM